MQQQSSNLIGQRVRIARLSKKPKVTQVELASRLQLEGMEINQTQVSKIENGTRPVRDKEVAIIAKILSVSASWLLGETNIPDRL